MKIVVQVALKAYSIAKRLATWIPKKMKSLELLEQAKSGITQLSHETIYNGSNTPTTPGLGPINKILWSEKFQKKSKKLYPAVVLEKSEKLSS